MTHMHFIDHSMHSWMISMDHRQQHTCANHISLNIKYTYLTNRAYLLCYCERQTRVCSPKLGHGGSWDMRRFKEFLGVRVEWSDCILCTCYEHIISVWCSCSIFNVLRHLNLMHIYITLRTQRSLQKRQELQMNTACLYLISGALLPWPHQSSAPGPRWGLIPPLPCAQPTSKLWLCHHSSMNMVTYKFMLLWKNASQ